MFKKKPQLLAILLSALLVCAGCEYVPNKTYKIKTVDGTVLTLACPMVDEGRSKLTYITDSDGCRLYK